MSEPIISVIMPAYNAEKYVTEAINSILSQTFTDFEFIIINDASTDSTKEIIKSFQDQRIKLINNEQNQGVAKSLNIGIAAAKGKYIARMDADDISLPERFQVQFDFMEQNKDIDICGSWMKTFGDKSEIAKKPLSHSDIRDTTFFFCAMLHPTIIFKRDLSLQYSMDFPRAEDYDLWCRKINELKFANIPEILLHYRIHSNQVGETNKIAQNQDTNLIRKRNLSIIGINLSEQEQRIYLDIIDWKFTPKNKPELILSIKMLDQISIAGIEHNYGSKFQETLRNFIKNIANSGIQNRLTSLNLYFSIFIKWKIFETPRANLRYIYHCLRNMLHV